MTVPGPPASSFGVNVLDYGADPTAVGDSVLAFEAAMMAAGGYSYGLINVPHGTYRVSRPVNLDIISTRTGTGYSSVKFKGAGFNFTQGSGTVIYSPGHDFCFKSTTNEAGTGNQQNAFEFDGFFFAGYGGIYIFMGSPIIRNCGINCWQGIVLVNCDVALIENVVGRGNNDLGLPQANNNTGQIGIAAGGGGIAVHNIDIRHCEFGTAVAVGGLMMSLDNIHVETSRVGLLLGWVFDGNLSFMSFQGTVTNFQQEATIIGVYCNNVTSSDLLALNINGHADPLQSVGVCTWAGVYLHSFQLSNLRMAIFNGNYTQSCIVTDGGTLAVTGGTWNGVYFSPQSITSSNGWQITASLQQNSYTNLYALVAGTYPIGTTVLPLAMYSSGQFPSWMVNGVSCQLTTGDTTRIQAGTTITLGTFPNINLSKPTVNGALTGVTSTLGGGDTVQFFSAAGVPVGALELNSLTLTPGPAPI